MNNDFSVSDSIYFGWETFKKRPWFIVGGFAGAITASMLISQIPALFDPQGTSPLTFVLAVGTTAVSLAIEILLLRFALKAIDSVETMTYNDALPPKPFWKYLGGQIVVALAVLVGFILLIIPGIIAALAFYFVQYLIVERKLWPFEAMKESARITKGHRWQLFLLFLAVIGINILGALALLIGLLITVPVSMLALARAYRVLEHKASEIAPVAPAAA